MRTEIQEIRYQRYLQRKAYRKLRAVQRRAQGDSLWKCCKFCTKRFLAANDRFEYCSQLCISRREKIAYPLKPESVAKIKTRLKSVEARKARNEALRKRMATDPSFKLRCLVSKQVWRALKLVGCTKSDSTLAHLPYSIPQLKAHLESQFNNLNGFTWENHGKLWHIDHIIPQALFAYTDLDSKAFRDCWALSNLRPLHKTENMRKSDKVLSI